MKKSFLIYNVQSTSFNKGIKLINLSGGIRAIQTYSGKVASVLHTGNCHTSGNSWMVLESWVKENNLESNGEPWEVYLTNPQDEADPTTWVTELVWPVK